jgi:hypothetical protein
MRAAQSQSKNNYDVANRTATGAASRADQIGSSLIPGLEQQANNPTGYSPQEMNDQLVAGEQGAGGANAGIVGQANLDVARSHNSAGYTAALGEAAREKTRTLSQNALDVKGKSADLAQKKQMYAQGQLGHLYDTNTDENLRAQGLSNEAVQTEVQAGQSGWFQNMQQLIKTLNGAGVIGGGG